MKKNSAYFLFKRSEQIELAIEEGVAHVIPKIRQCETVEDMIHIRTTACKMTNYKI